MLLATLGLAVGCSTESGDGQRAVQGTAIGIDVESMNKAVAPGDDFYVYANGNWLGTAIVPDDAVAARRRDNAAELTRTRLLAIVQELAGTPQERGSDEALVRRFYLSYLNRAGIEKAGRAPMQAELDRIAAIADRTDLSREIGAQVRGDAYPLQESGSQIDALFAMPVMPSPETAENVPWLVAGGLGLPADSYDDMGLRGAYRDYVATVLAWAGVADANGQAGKIVNLEARLADAGSRARSGADLGASVANWTRADLDQRAPGIAWSAFLEGAGLSGQESFATVDAGSVVAGSALVASEDIATWKAWLAFHAVNRVADMLPQRVANARFRLYGNRIDGLKTEPALKARAVERIGQIYGDILARYYLERYLDPAEQQDVTLIANNVREAFARRIESAGWIEPDTRDAAVAKLEAMAIGIGGPSAVPRTARPRPKGTSAIDLERAASLGMYRAQLARLGKAPDREQWLSEPYDFDGLYLPLPNSLEIGAAMLQPPYYAAGSDVAANYGAIGAVIGRNMAYALDDVGGQIDAEGKLMPIWASGDADEFKRHRNALAAQYDGRLTNGARALRAATNDLTGLSIAYDAYRASLGRKEPPVIEGFTGDQRFFIAFAQMWATKYRDGTASSMIAARVETVRNIDAWYRAFDVQPGARHYLVPEARVRIW
ncbi:M13-type metalloendopeptidase [Croceicoccus bisphenolivorans]|uniref:M13-type metalloendopeptidase n=1 Tax=Croceicoccus bisphenolivorans TaxID=1783232 RepID=UPI00082D15C4|nr:M13 family metallopeptidase [Croceicoccus bisphenolivorans]